MGAATRFLDAYEDADEVTIRRARGWAVLRGLGLIGIGRSTLDRVLASTAFGA